MYAYLLKILNDKDITHDSKSDDYFVGELLYNTEILDIILDTFDEQDQ